MLPRRIVTATLAAPLVLAGAATAAYATYPPSPTPATTQTATTVAAGGAVSFTFGDPNSANRFLPGSTVNITCQGPSDPLKTVTTASSAGVASATFTFTFPGVWTCSAEGTSIGNTALTLTAEPVTVQGVPAVNPAALPTPVSAQDAGTTAAVPAPAAAGEPGALAQTGGNNTLTIAAAGAGLLLAGVGAVAVARRREHN